MGSEFDDFFAQLDEISTDSLSYDNLQLQKARIENKKMRQWVVQMKDSTKELLEMWKNERQISLTLQTKLDDSLQSFNGLQRRYDELERTNINKTFHLTELMNEMKQKHIQEHENFIELSQDYFVVLSDVTCFYNYELKKQHSKLISKTERFLRDALGDLFKKPKIINSKRRNDGTESVTSRASSRASSISSKRGANKIEVEVRSKRRKTDIWDMKSISQASSPAATIPFDEETSDLSSEICEAESSFSFNTFSIGNETSFSFLQSQTTSPNNKPVCKCRHYAESETILVSVGINTDPPDEPLPSVPSLLDVDVDMSWDDVPTEDAQLVKPPIVKKPIVDEVTSSSNNESSYEDAEPLLHQSPIRSTSSTADLPISPKKFTVEQGTSPEPVTTSNKSTLTTRSTTTRGTLTIAPVTRNFGVQFPEISLEKIFSETIFELPDCISPLHDLFEELSQKEMASTETITELCNVNREIDYKVKRDSEDPSFVILGQTLFDLFLKRIQKSNKALSNDEITRKKIWKHLKRQLLDRFSELSFDETLNSSMSDVEPYEKSRDDFGGRKEGFTEPKLKDGFEEFAADFESSDEELEDCGMTGKLTEIEEVRNQDRSMQCEEKSSQSQDRSMQSHDEVTQGRHEVAQSHQVTQSNHDVISSRKKVTQNHDEVTQIHREDESLAQMHGDSQAKVTSHVAINTDQFQDDIASQAEPIEDTIAELVNHEDSSTSEFVTSTQDVAEPINFEAEPILFDPPSEPELDFASPSEPEMDPNFDDEFEKAFNGLNAAWSSPLPSQLEPIDDLTDIIWSSLFTDNNEEMLEDCPVTSKEVLDGFDVDHDPIEIPTECDDEITEILKANVPSFTEFETPKSPLPFMMSSDEPMEPQIIPVDAPAIPKKSTFALDSVLDYNQELRQSLVQWQQRHKLTSKLLDKQLCKTRKAIRTYIESEWTNANLETCLKSVDAKSEIVVTEAIFETIEDNKDEKEISLQFTPPAPPLPHYQQKLILLIKKLSEVNPRLPHRLVEFLEDKLFRLDNNSITIDELRNLSYYYSSLIDLFFEGNTSMVFYFIVKCFYFFGYKSIPMVFVLIKAFPMVLPKKSELLKKYSQHTDWENMTGLELSKVRLDIEWMDSLDLVVMYLLTCIQQYRRKSHESNVIKDHELFNYLPKFYGFPLSFMAAPKLLDILVQRIDEGKLENMTMSLILLAKRTNPDFTIRTLLKGQLVPMLEKCEAMLGENVAQETVAKVVVLVEAISSILKTLAEEKEKSFRSIFTLILRVNSRVKDRTIQESCIKAILRLQRFIDNPKEVVTIIQGYLKASGGSISDDLRYAVQTFVHRRSEKVFIELT